MKKVTYKIEPTGISVFTGFGGMDAGARRAGLRILAGSDIEPVAGIVHENNTRAANPAGSDDIITDGIFLSGVEGDVNTLTADRLLAEIKSRLKLNFSPGKLDFLLGGPSCQPFSVANPKRSPFDKRATLVFQMLRLARELRPKIIIIEQVPAIRSRKMRPIWNKVRMVLNNMQDYHWAAAKLNSKHFGGRQDRIRLFTILVRKDLGAMPSFPKPTEPDMSLVSLRALLPHIKHFSPGQGVNAVHSSKGRLCCTITANASEWVYESDGVPRKMVLTEKQRVCDLETQNLDGLTRGQQNRGLGNSVQPSLMEAVIHHCNNNILKTNNQA